MNAEFVKIYVNEARGDHMAVMIALAAASSPFRATPMPFGVGTGGERRGVVSVVGPPGKGLHC
jgi:hypothetical protein